MRKGKNEMGKGKGEMVVADDDVREHVRATSYWGKDNDDGGKGKGNSEMGKGTEVSK